MCVCVCMPYQPAWRSAAWPAPAAERAAVTRNEPSEKWEPTSPCRGRHLQGGALDQQRTSLPSRRTHTRVFPEDVPAGSEDVERNFPVRAPPPRSDWMAWCSASCWVDSFWAGCVKNSSHAASQWLIGCLCVLLKASSNKHE